MWRWTKLVLWTFLSVASAPSYATPQGVQGQQTVHGFIVQMREPTLVEAGRSLAARATALTADRALPLTADRSLGGGWQHLRADRAIGRAEAAEWAQLLRADPRVLAVVPDVREQRQAVTPNDARFGQQWWLQATASAGTPPVAADTGVAGFAQAWNRSRGNPVSGPGVVVAVLDSGITSHPELNASVLPGYDFVSDLSYSNDGNGRDNDAVDPGDAISAAERAAQPQLFAGCPDTTFSSWHGTVIAGQLAATTNNTEGVAAANWAGRVLPVRVAGKCGAAVSDIVDGLRWAAGLTVAGAPANPNPARLIVLSYTGVDSCDINSSNAAVADTARLYRSVINELRTQGAGGAGSMVIVAAGNQRSAVGRPASCPGAFAVASVNREGFKSNYSNFGPEIALAATGGDGDTGRTCDAQLADSGIVSTGNLGDITPGAPGYVAASGTSFAAPVVAGAASLMLNLNANLTLMQLEQGLKTSARPHVQVPLLRSCVIATNSARCSCTTSTCGAGLLDASRALAYALAPDSPLPAAPAAVVLADTRIQTCAAITPQPPAPPVTPPVTPPVNPPAPNPPVTPPAPVPIESGGGGGGAMSGIWLALLAASVLLLNGSRPKPLKRLAAANGSRRA